jgi:YHS domain-containing protein
MKSQISWLAIVLGVAVCVPFVNANEEKKDEAGETAKAEGKEKSPKKSEKGEAEFKATCPVSGSDAKKENASKYREGEAYFCCEKCKAAFDAEPAKFAAKANLQLVQTKQFRQTACPVSGSKVNKEQTIKVSGVKVGFCCDKCKGSLETASQDDQLTKIFGDAVFTKSFAVKKADTGKKPTTDAGSPSTK